MESKNVYLADRDYWISRDHLSRGLLPTEIVNTLFNPIIPIIGGFIFFKEGLVPRQAFGLASVLMGLLVFQMAA